MKTINEDELVGYILRKANELDDAMILSYDIVRLILDLEMEFLSEKGIATEE